MYYTLPVVLGSRNKRASVGYFWLGDLYNINKYIYIYIHIYTYYNVIIHGDMMICGDRFTNKNGIQSRKMGMFCNESEVVCAAHSS